MTETHIIPVPDPVRDACYINNDQYLAMYERSISDPDGFWSEQADIFIDWYDKPQQVAEADFITGNVSWFAGGQLNICYNCIDRHLPERAGQTAIIWEGDDPSQDQRITYQQLHDAVCKLANGLRARGVRQPQSER